MDDEDWDEEFGYFDATLKFGTTNSTIGRTSRIVGITADRFVPNAETEWDNDFDLVQENSNIFFSKPQPISSSFFHKAELEKEIKKVEEKYKEIEEDWDAELGIDIDNSSTPQLFPSLSGKTVQIKDKLIAKKHQLLQEEDPIVIVKYPKPTLLFTLKEKEGHRLFNQDEEFYTWIENLMSKPQASSKMDHSQTFRQDIVHIEKFSKEWVEKYSIYCNILARNSETEELLWDILTQYFTELEVSGLPSALPAQQKSRVTAANIQMVQIASKIWSVDNECTYQQLLDIATKFDPPQSQIFYLLRAETYAHHISAGDFEFDPLSMFCDLYLQYCKDHSENSIEFKVQLLTDVHLFVNCYSPLSTAKLDIDQHIRKEEIHQKLKKQVGVEELLVDEKRIKLLNELYVKMKGHSFLKAKAVFVLGMSDKSKDYRITERKYLEAIYILHELEPIAEGLYPLVSELGSNCLSAYADNLLNSYKYKYAILVYHACSISLQLRGRSKAYFKLLRKIATIAKDKDDYKRAIICYKELLQKYIEDQKSNEMKYVSEALSNIYVDLGNFSIAEEYLLGAISKLSKKNQTPSDQRTFQLYYNLSRVYMKSYNFERAILLLESLLNYPSLPKSKYSLVIISLAQAYIKVRNTVKCELLMKTLSDHSGHENKLKSKNLKSSTSTSRSKSHGSIAQSSSTQSSSGSLKIVKLQLEISSRNYYVAGKLAVAYTTINSCIESISKSNINMGRFFYLRAKILKGFCMFYYESSQLPVSSDGNLLFNQIGDIIQECIATFNKAYNCYLSLEDDIRIAQILAHISEVYIEYIYPQVMYQSRSLESCSQLPYYSVSAMVKEDDFDNEPPQEHHTITIEMIANQLNAVLDISTDLSAPLLSLRAYILQAEILVIQNKVEIALAYFEECNQSIVNLILILIIGRSYSIGFLQKTVDLLKRLVRLLFSFSPDITNKNLFLFDAVNILENTIHHSLNINNSNTSGNSANTDNFSLSELLLIHKLKKKVNYVDYVSKGKENAAKKLHRTTTLKKLFGDNVDWSSLSSSSDNPAELLWEELYRIKTHISRYFSGKISKEDLNLYNQRSLRTLSNLSATLRTSPYCNVLLPPNYRSNGEYKGTSLPFVEIEKAHKNIRLLVYSFYLTGSIYTFIPLSSERRVHRLTLKNGPLNVVDEKKSNYRYHIKVSLLSNEKEFGIFEVRSAVTVKEFLNFICDVNKWSQGNEETSQHGKKSRFLGFRTTKILKLPIKPIDCSKYFIQELTELVSLVYPLSQTPENVKPNLNSSSPIKQSAENSNEGFRKSSANLTFGIVSTNNEKSITPISDSEDLTIGEIFPNDMDLSNSPVQSNQQIYLFATSFSPTICTMNNAVESLINGQSLEINSEMNNYLTTLLKNKQSFRLTDNQNKRIVEEMQNLFTWLKDILPVVDPKEEARARRHSLNRRLSAFPFNSDDKSSFDPLPKPIIMICNLPLHIFPWEILFEKLVVRYVALSQAIRRVDLNKFAANNADLLPTYRGTLYQNFDKQQSYNEDIRLQLIEKITLSNLSFLPLSERRRPSELSSVSFHLQIRRFLRKRPKLLKYISFIELDNLQDKPQDVIRRLENKPDTEFTVLLFTYADLIEMNEIVVYLLNCTSDCTLLFIPSMYLKNVTLRLLKSHAKFTKNEQHLMMIPDRYQYVMTLINNLQKDYQIPIAVFNTP